MADIRRKHRDNSHCNFLQSLDNFKRGYHHEADEVMMKRLVDDVEDCWTDLQKRQKEYIGCGGKRSILATTSFLEKSRPENSRIYKFGPCPEILIRKRRV